VHFPKKKFFKMNPATIEERKRLLESFMNEVCEAPDILRYDVFCKFLHIGDQEKAFLKELHG